MKTARSIPWMLDHYRPELMADPRYRHVGLKGRAPREINTDQSGRTLHVRDNREQFWTRWANRPLIRRP